MPAVWFVLKRSLQCRSEASDVYDPKVSGNLSNISTEKTGRSGCSRSISNLKDVIHGSKRYMEKPPSCSPRSIEGSEFLNPITHEVVFGDSNCEIKISGAGALQQSNSTGSGGGGRGGSGSTLVGTLRLGTPGSHNNPRVLSTLPRNVPRSFSRRQDSGFNGIPSSHGAASGKDSLGSSSLTGHKCDEHFAKWEAVEAHHLSKHAVTELVEGDLSRKIVEIICQTSWVESDNNSGHIERILKVHNMQKVVAQLEEHREVVKNQS